MSEESQSAVGNLSTWIEQHWKPLLAGIILAHLGLAAYSGAIHSPAWDEAGYLVAGIDHWDRGRFEMYRVNPPLPRMIAAIPAVVAGHQPLVPKTSPIFKGRPEWPTGIRFLRDEGRGSLKYFVWGRWMLLPFSVAAAWILFRWGRELYGLTAGLTAAALWCFEPNILASTAMFTPDLAATVSGIVAAYSFRSWLKNPDWHRAALAGLGLGAAEMTKTTWVILFGLWPAVWVVSRIGTGCFTSWRWFRELTQGALILCLAVYCINLEYGFEGTGRRLGNYQFVSAPLRGDGELEVEGLPAGNRFQNTMLASLPVPLPANYVLGIDLQKREFEIGYLSYLLGELRQEGWWYYYLCALAWKVPLGIWVMCFIGFVSAWKFLGAPNWREQAYIAILPIGIVAFVSSQVGINHHVRYVVPALPFVFLWACQASRLFESQYSLAGSVAAVSLTWAMLSSLAGYPHSLSYFNELVGGPTRAPAYLGCGPMDSNLEWGQDVLLLKAWLDEHPQVYLEGMTCGGMGEFRQSYNLPVAWPPGGFDPEAKDGSQYRQSAGPQPGWYALSVKDVYIPNGRFAYFREFQPFARVGYSTLVYGISDEEADAFHERQLRLETKTPSK